MIIGIVLGALILGFIIFKVSRNKRQDQKTSTESIVGTIGNSISRMWSSTAKDLRTGEVVKAELLAKIDHMLTNGREQFRSHLIQLETAAKTIEHSKKKTSQNIIKFKKEAMEHKALYEKNLNELDKTKAMQYLKHLKNAEATMASIEVRGKEINEKLEFSQFDYENLTATLENKKIEIISEINPALNYKASQFSIADLEREFETKVKEQDITNSVDERMNDMESNDLVTDFDLENAFNELN